MRKLHVGVTALSGAALAGLMLVPAGAGSTGSVPPGSPVRHSRCEWNDDHARVLCVHRAPQSICREAMGGRDRFRPCWWFVGSDTMIVFGWDGRVSVS